MDKSTEPLKTRQHVTAETLTIVQHRLSGLDKQQILTGAEYVNTQLRRRLPGAQYVNTQARRRLPERRSFVQIAESAEGVVNWD